MMRRIFAICLLSFGIRALNAYETRSPHEATLIGLDSINRSFVIDYTNDVFLKDGKSFHYVSGSFHYFRTPRTYWRDRFWKLRAAGLNAVTTVVEWSSHEPDPDDYQFTGNHDIEYFVQLAAEEDLAVILRPGPYICAERDFGGLPPWLLTKYPNISLRTNDTDYQREVRRWFDVLFKRLQKYFYRNGGPIIMVQVENEYGNFAACNLEHRIWLRDEMRRHVGDAAVLFTTDNTKALECGNIPGVYATIDFGTARNVSEAFAKMRQFSPRGPLVNSEFYPGWFSHWGERMKRVETREILTTMKELLDVKANFNFYMFSGGTNFGFTNGANYDERNDEYQPQLTSYDYDAPLDEAGDPTSKYFAIRDLISKYYKLPDVAVPQPRPKGNYGEVRMEAVCSIFDDSCIKYLGRSQDPKTFEFLKLKHGYVLYETTIPENMSDPATLFVSDLRDRAIVYVDRLPRGILDRRQKIHTLPLINPAGSNLSLLVENQGRITSGNHIKDMKGLLSVPSLNGHPLVNWTMKSVPLRNISWIYRLPLLKNEVMPPALYIGELVLPSHEEPLDTYLDLTGWGKGVIFVNNVNLGRYWPSIGPQVTLYVPGCYLRAGPQKNKIVVFETEYTPTGREIVFTNKAILDKIPPAA